MSIIKKFIFTSCLIIIIAVVGFAYLVFHNGKSFISEKIISANFVKQQVGQENESLLKIAPRLLGFTQPITYLLLFQNNTEMRPAGGFIGSYAVVKMDKGQMQILKMEGTEVLDKQTPVSWKIVPPQPLTDHLGVDKWYFRDSNWSPDFGESAKKALELYKGENGVSADNIQVVGAITPTVLEKLLELTGPVKVGDEEYSADNFTAKLEYEVEYGYREKAISFLDRKDIMQPLMLAILDKIKTGMIFNFNQYLGLLTKLADEKQILFYTADNDLAKIIKEKNWNGEIKQVAGDYLLWVDANLAALKTDFVLKRNLKYHLEKDQNGKWIARVEMQYDHTGRFDWRTTRYRTYARIFVPLGAELIKVEGAMKWDRTTAPGTVDQGEELGKTWFGAFVSIEPGKTGVLSFSYYLPEAVAQKINAGLYTLFVQKQAGTINHSLTLNLNFDTNIVSSTPMGEVKDGVYGYSGDLKQDREFVINF